jgi:hypothetical protein
MKVKDYIGWLQNSHQSRAGYTWHYYPNKSKSACGKSSHPKTQFDAVYIWGEYCKTCQGYCKRNGIKMS